MRMSPLEHHNEGKATHLSGFSLRGSLFKARGHCFLLLSFPLISESWRVVSSAPVFFYVKIPHEVISFTVMKTIPLHPFEKGYFTIIDKADYEKISPFKWRVIIGRKGNDVYAYCNGIGGMHRFLLDPPPDFETDHVDRNSLNNTRDNLRPATRSQNMANRKKQKNNTSGYTGVFWCKDVEKWRALVQYQGKKVHVGRFDDPEEAAHRRDEKMLELFGEFAKLNFPLDEDTL